MKKLTKAHCHFIENHDCLFVDVDDTLVCWEYEYPLKSKTITVEDPNCPGLILNLLPHQSHINTLKRNSNRGKMIIVWSAAGTNWAKKIVEVLELEQYVTLIMEKPIVYMDDVAMEHWNPKRIYIKNDVEGKQ